MLSAPVTLALGPEWLSPDALVSAGLLVVGAAGSWFGLGRAGSRPLA